jgi:hypothetical protein
MSVRDKARDQPLPHKTRSAGQEYLQSGTFELAALQSSAICEHTLHILLRKGKPCDHPPNRREASAPSPLCSVQRLH